MNPHPSWLPVIAHFARVQDHASLVKIMVLSKSLFALAMPALYSSVFDPSHSTSGTNPWSLWLPQKRRQLVLLLLHSSGFIHRVKGQFRLANNHETNESLKDVVLFADYWSSVKWIPSDAWQWLEWQAVDTTIKAGPSSLSKVNLALDFTLHHARALDSITIHLGPENDASERNRSGKNGFTIKDLVHEAEQFSVLTSIQFQMMTLSGLESKQDSSSPSWHSAFAPRRRSNLNKLLCTEPQEWRWTRLSSAMSALERDKIERQKQFEELGQAITTLKQTIHKQEEQEKRVEHLQALRAATGGINLEAGNGSIDYKFLTRAKRWAKSMTPSSPLPTVVVPEAVVASSTEGQQREVSIFVPTVTTSDEEREAQKQHAERLKADFEQWIYAKSSKIKFSKHAGVAKKEPSRQQQEVQRLERNQEQHQKQQREHPLSSQTPPPPPPSPPKPSLYDSFRWTPVKQIEANRQFLEELQNAHQQMASNLAFHQPHISPTLLSLATDLSMDNRDPSPVFSTTQQNAALEFISRHKFSHPKKLGQVLGHPSWPFAQAIAESTFSPTRIVIDLTTLFTPDITNTESMMNEMVAILNRQYQDLQVLELKANGYLDGKERVFAWAVDKRIQYQSENDANKACLNSVSDEKTLSDVDDDENELESWVHVSGTDMDEEADEPNAGSDSKLVLNNGLPPIRKLVLEVSDTNIVVDGLNAFRDTLVDFKAWNGMPIGRIPWDWALPKLETLDLSVCRQKLDNDGFLLNCIRVLCPNLQCLRLLGETSTYGNHSFHFHSSQGWQPPTGLKILRLENYVYDEIDFSYLRDLESLQELYWMTSGKVGGDGHKARPSRPLFGVLERDNKEYTSQSFQGPVSWKIPEMSLQGMRFDHLLDATLVGGAFEDWRFGFFRVAPNLVRFSAGDQCLSGGIYHSIQKSNLKDLVEAGLKDSCKLEILDLVNVSFDLEASQLLLRILASIANLDEVELSFPKLWAFSFDCSRMEETMEELERTLFMIMKRPGMKLVMLDKVDKRFVKRWLKPVDPLVVPMPIAFPDSLAGSCVKHLGHCILVSKQTSKAYRLQDAFLNM